MSEYLKLSNVYIYGQELGGDKQNKSAKFCYSNFYFKMVFYIVLYYIRKRGTGETSKCGRILTVGESR